MAPHSVLASENAVSAARRGVSESRALVLLQGSNSENSTQVMSELQLANELQIPMFWIELEKAKTPILDQFSMTTRSKIQFLGDGTSSLDIQEAVDFIKEFLATQVGIVPSSEEEELSEEQIELANEQLNKALRSRSRNKYDLMREALDDGANDYDAIDQAGCTVLHWAIRKADVEVIEFLLTTGADLDIPNDKGETPRSLMADLSFD